MGNRVSWCAVVILNQFFYSVNRGRGTNFHEIGNFSNLHVDIYKNNLSAMTSSAACTLFNSE